MTFERSTKVLYSLWRYCLADGRRGIRVAYRSQDSGRAYGITVLRLRPKWRGFDLGRQHVQGHHKGGEPRDQGPKE
jgi:hypothetical protein